MNDYTVKTYLSQQGQVKRFDQHNGMVTMCLQSETDTCYQLPISAVLGLKGNKAPEQGDFVKLTFSGPRPVAARIKD